VRRVGKWHREMIQAKKMGCDTENQVLVLLKTALIVLKLSKKYCEWIT